MNTGIRAPSSPPTGIHIDSLSSTVILRFSRLIVSILAYVPTCVVIHVVSPLSLCIVGFAVICLKKLIDRYTTDGTRQILQRVLARRLHDGILRLIRLNSLSVLLEST